MTHSKTRLALILTGSIALSGCNAIHGLLGLGSSHQPKVRVAQPAQSGSAQAQAIEEGRQHLDKDQNGLAIESFQRAMSLGSPAPAALNGMGVAFARLGRYDLAQRYFTEALVLDPSDARYAANLARLTRSAAFAMRYDGDIAAAAIGSGTSDPEASAAVAATEPQPGQLTRVSSHEYRIQTVEPQAAPLVARSSSASRSRRIAASEVAKAVPAEAGTAGRTTVVNPYAQ